MGSARSDVVLADDVLVGAAVTEGRDHGALQALDIAASTPDEPKLLLRHLRAGAPVPHGRPHVHRFFEVVTVAKGRGAHRVDGARIDMPAGKVTWILPGQLHDPRGLEPAERWVLSFAPDVLSDAASGVQAFAPRHDFYFLPLQSVVAAADRQALLSRPELRRWLEWHEHLSRELHDRALGYGEAVRAITRLMMLFLARRALPSAPSNANPLVTSVFQFIEARYRFPIGLADVARAVGRSPAYLTDLVRRETGRAVGQWIIERRMADARRLLLETEEGVGAVAEAAGYLDPRHFSAQFKRLHGTTPQAWRKSRRA